MQDRCSGPHAGLQAILHDRIKWLKHNNNKLTCRSRLDLTPVQATLHDRIEWLKHNNNKLTHHMPQHATGQATFALTFSAFFFLQRLFVFFFATQSQSFEAFL